MLGQHRIRKRNTCRDPRFVYPQCIRVYPKTRDAPARGVPHFQIHSSPGPSFSDTQTPPPPVVKRILESPLNEASLTLKSASIYIVSYTRRSIIEQNSRLDPNWSLILGVKWNARIPFYSRRIPFYSLAFHFTTAVVKWNASFHFTTTHSILLPCG